MVSCGVCVVCVYLHLGRLAHQRGNLIVFMPLHKPPPLNSEFMSCMNVHLNLILLRGKCSVQSVHDIPDLAVYVANENHFFHCYGYKPESRYNKMGHFV